MDIHALIRGCFFTGWMFDAGIHALIDGRHINAGLSFVVMLLWAWEARKQQRAYARNSRVISRETLERIWRESTNAQAKPA